MTQGHGMQATSHCIMTSIKTTCIHVHVLYPDYDTTRSHRHLHAMNL
jgi:hypothetical protein